MQKFKEIYKEISEAGVEKLTDMTAVKQKMVEIIQNYAPRSFTTYVIKAPRVIDYVFSGENAKAEVTLLKRVIVSIYPEINYAVRPYNDSFILTVFI